MADYSDKSGLALQRSNQAEFREEIEQLNQKLDDLNSQMNTINWLELDRKIEMISNQFEEDHNKSSNK